MAFIDDFFADFTLAKAPKAAALKRLKALLGTSAPADYLAFMARHNGADGAGHQLHRLHSIEEVEQISQEMEMPEGTWMIGGDGMGSAYVLDLREKEPRFLLTTHGGKVIGVRKLGPSFESFLRTLAAVQASKDAAEQPAPLKPPAAVTPIAEAGRVKLDRFKKEGSYVEGLAFGEDGTRAYAVVHTGIYEIDVAGATRLQFFEGPKEIDGWWLSFCQRLEVQGDRVACYGVDPGEPPAQWMTVVLDLKTGKWTSRPMQPGEPGPRLWSAAGTFAKAPAELLTSVRGKPVAIQMPKGDYYYASAAQPASGAWVALCTRTQVEFLKLPSGKPQAQAKLRGFGFSTRCAATPNGDAVVVGTAQPGVLACVASDGRVRWSVAPGKLDAEAKMDDWIDALAVIPVSQQVLVARSGAATGLFLHDLAAGKEVAAFPFARPEEKARSIAVSPDGRWAITSSCTPQLRIWRIGCSS